MKVINEIICDLKFALLCLLIDKKQCLRIFQVIIKVTDPFIGISLTLFKRAYLSGQVKHPLLDRVDGELAAVHPDPPPAELFSNGKSRTGTGKGVEDNIAFIRRGFDDTFNELFWFLGGVFISYLSLLSSSICKCNICPPISW